LPASSLSSSISWGIYFAAAFALVIVCSPVLGGVRNYAYGDSAAETARGLARVFDGLSPGLTVEFSFHSPSKDGHIELHGKSVVVVWGGATSARETSRSLPDESLSPELHYYFLLAGERVEVFDSVRV